MKHTSGSADLALVGGTIYTMDPERPRAEAVAVRDGRIEAAGSAADVQARIGPSTHVIELRGRAVTPGLVDGHCHLYGMGHALETVSLRGVTTPEAAAQIVLDAARELAPGEWVTGRGWDQNLWPGQEFPRHEVLDRALPERPVSLRRIDGHALWANAAALRIAGVNRETRDSPGGKIVRDAQGEATGVLIDDAMHLVESKIPAPSIEVLQRRILRAARLAVENGLVCVHEMGIDDATVEAYRKLVIEQKLPLRVYAFLGARALRGIATRRHDVDTDGSAMLTVRGVKLFADGALGSRGSWMLEPFSDDPGNTGLVLTSTERLAQAVRALAGTGWQLAVHAIGDAANRAVLDAVEQGAGGRTDLRFRIEHVQVIAREDMPRFAQLGVIASVQPAFATSDMPWAEARVGPERIQGAYAWRSLLEAGARLSGGSDFPIEELPPLLGLHAAVTRQDAHGKPAGGWHPEQRLTLDEAIRLFTADAAWASFTEQHRGVVAPGYVADLTVFDADLSADQRLLERRVDFTIVGGAVAYDRAQRSATPSAPATGRGAARTSE